MKLEPRPHPAVNLFSSCPAAMAESYLFSMLVELEGNPDIPKLKNKLVKYFQSKKSSNGGDCLVEYDISKGQGTVVRFRTAEGKL